MITAKIATVRKYKTLQNNRIPVVEQLKQFVTLSFRSTFSSISLERVVFQEYNSIYFAS